MILKSKSFLFVLICAGFLISCGGNQVMPTPGTFNNAQWESKVEIKDLAKDKSNSLSVDILAERNGPMRMEASAIMGIPVASYVMDRSGFKCAVYRSKIFYEGALTEQALEPLIHFPLSPVVLSRIAFDEPVHGGDWKCEAGHDGFVSTCTSDSRKMKIAWNREDTKRTIHVDGPGFQMTWKFGAPKTDVQFKPTTFQLEPKDSFKVIRL